MTIQSYADFLKTDLGQWLDERLPQKPDGKPDIEREQSDVVHDLLAHLAEQMIEMNKQKPALVKGFLGWLEAEILKGSVEVQKNKTKIKAFHEADFEALLEILKKNKVVPSPCPSRIRAAIQKEFNAAMEKLNPLKAQIAATDRLIDLVVYRLYGLTEREVTVVEGNEEEKRRIIS
ncbi:hypothetical protein FJZ31_26150 [Candidatus Poribacteria bacterium]|nr:hypothetical protein [Candidatus Poribacteria bacterium]